jgi:hypothetical protein
VSPLVLVVLVVLGLLRVPGMLEMLGKIHPLRHLFVLEAMQAAVA